MKQNFFKNLIYNNKFKFRFTRHLLFWLVFLSIFTFEGIKSSNFTNYLKINILFLPLDILSTYVLIYFIYPLVLIEKKYFKPIIYFILLLIFQNCISIPMQLYIKPLIVNSYKQPSLIYQFFNDFIILFMIFGTAIFIKTIKYLSIVEIKNHELERNNIKSQMALLNSQLHPHFLFNTLNNLYSLSVEKSDKVPDTILKLSDIIRYMLYDYSNQYIDIKKEIEVINSYIEIEKLRYDDHLKVDIEINPVLLNHKAFSIPPLLIFTFVENAFKHGISKSLENPWIDIKLKLEKDFFIIDIKNSIDNVMFTENDNREKIGLQNVKKRLELYYPKKHILKISKGKDSFCIYLEINIRK